MALLADIQGQVDEYLKGDYQVVRPQDIPEAKDVPLGKTAMQFDATVLFIDVRQSTDITDSFRQQTAAKMMKSYFWGAVKIITARGGKVRSFNGDGMLALFHGKTRTLPAVKSAMQIDWFVGEVLQPKFQRYFKNNMSAVGKALSFEIGCGIDDGSIYAVRVGQKGTNDVAWVGRPTNTAAKLSNVGKGDRNIYITGIGYERLHDWAKLSKGVDMWSSMSFMDIGGVSRGVRSTTYRWSLA